MAEWYQKSESEALEHFSAKTEGLSSAEAEERLRRYGENKLAEGKKKTVLQVFLSQFADLLVLILIAAAIISMFSGNIESTIVIFADIHFSTLCIGKAAYPFEIFVSPGLFIFDILLFSHFSLPLYSFLQSIWS